MDSAPLDCAIIGAGPAGLTAALYLARFRRDIRVIDAGNSRAALIPTIRNFPGFPAGISGVDLLSRLVAQVGVYGIHVQRAKVQSLRKDAEMFELHSSLGPFTARTSPVSDGR